MVVGVGVVGFVVVGFVVVGFVVVGLVVGGGIVDTLCGVLNSRNDIDKLNWIKNISFIIKSVIFKCMKFLTCI